MADDRVRPGRWRRATGEGPALDARRQPYRAAAPDPGDRGAPTVEESGYYMALSESWLARRVRRFWRMLAGSVA